GKVSDLKGNILNSVASGATWKRQYESNFCSRFWLRGTCVCELWPKSGTSHDEDRGVCRWMFLVHPASIRQGTRRAQNGGGLLRWNRTKTDLQARDVGKNKVSRINRDHL